VYIYIYIYIYIYFFPLFSLGVLGSHFVFKYLTYVFQVFRNIQILLLLNHAGSIIPGFLHCAYSFWDGQHSLHALAYLWLG
jgi:hypothetical protein